MHRNTRPGIPKTLDDGDEPLGELKPCFITSWLLKNALKDPLSFTHIFGLANAHRSVEGLVSHAILSSFTFGSSPRGSKDAHKTVVQVVSLWNASTSRLRVGPHVDFTKFPADVPSSCSCKMRLDHAGCPVRRSTESRPHPRRP